MFLQRRGISSAATVAVLVAVIAVAGAGYLLYSSGTGSRISSISSPSSSSTNSTTSAASLRVFMELQPSTPLISSDVVANYTLGVTILGIMSSPLAIDASSSGGVTVQASPAQIQPGRESNQVSMSFKVPDSVAVGTYALNITVSSSGQSYSQRFSIEVVKYLVVTVGTDFVPPKITVPKGSTVYWMRLNGALSQYDNGDHNVVFNGFGASSPTLAQYQSWSYTFSKAGDFSYYCTFHSGQNGEIIVV